MLLCNLSGATERPFRSSSEFPRQQNFKPGMNAKSIPPVPYFLSTVIDSTSPSSAIS